MAERGKEAAWIEQKHSNPSSAREAKAEAEAESSNTILDARLRLADYWEVEESTIGLIGVPGLLPSNSFHYIGHVA